MANVDALRPPDPQRMQADALEEHTELWWSRQPVKSISCYFLAVLLIIACGIGGIVLLSTTTSRSGEWRLAVGATLCILALLILLKQLLSSAVQDMHCISRREHIEILKSGGLSDVVMFLISALVILVCGVVLLALSSSGESPGFPPFLVTMHSVGVVLVVVGVFIIAAVVTFELVKVCKSCAPRRFHPRNVNVFSISGPLAQRQNTTSSLANLI